MSQATTDQSTHFRRMGQQADTPADWQYYHDQAQAVDRLTSDAILGGYEMRCYRLELHSWFSAEDDDMLEQIMLLPEHKLLPLVHLTFPWFAQNYDWGDADVAAAVTERYSK